MYPFSNNYQKDISWKILLANNLESKICGKVYLSNNLERKNFRFWHSSTYLQKKISENFRFVFQCKFFSKFEKQFSSETSKKLNFYFCKKIFYMQGKGKFFCVFRTGVLGWQHRGFGLSGQKARLKRSGAFNQHTILNWNGSDAITHNHSYLVTSFFVLLL